MCMCTRRQTHTHTISHTHTHKKKFQVFTSVPAFASTKAVIQDKGFSVAEEDTLLVYRPNAPIEVMNRQLIY